MTQTAGSAHSKNKMNRPKKKDMHNFQTTSLITTPTCLWHFCRVNDSNTSLGNLCQGWTTFSMNKFFLIFNLKLLWCNLKPFLLVLSLVPPAFMVPSAAAMSSTILSLSSKLKRIPSVLCLHPPQTHFKVQSVCFWLTLGSGEWNEDHLLHLTEAPSPFWFLSRNFSDSELQGGPSIY